MASANRKRRLQLLEQRLQEVVFGQDIIHTIANADADEPPAEDETGEGRDTGPTSAYNDLGHDFWATRKHKKSGTDSISDDSDADELTDEKVIVKSGKEVVEKSKSSVWTDADDEITAAEGFTNAIRLPKKLTAESKFKTYQSDKFTSLYKRPKWADGAREKNTSDSDDDYDDSLSKVAGNLMAKKISLSRGILVFNKCAALNADLTRSYGYNSIQFHPKFEIGIVSNRKSVDFFKLEDRGKQSENRVIKSYDFSGIHVERVRVTPDGQELIIGTHFTDSCTYSIDLTTGKTRSFSLMKSSENMGLRGMCLSPDGSLIACCSENGRILIMDAKAKEFIKSMKMNDDVKCLCFSADSQQLFSHGTGGQVYIWDVKQERLVNKFYDEGAVIGTAVAASPNGQFLAAGSESGVVNVYNVKTCEREQVPKPLKSLMNLTTEISSINFNHSSELFSFCSRLKQNAVRLTHVPSRSVYSNFPYQGEAYGRVAEMHFSPASGFAGMATNQRSVNLFRLCHFAGY